MYRTAFIITCIAMTAPVFAFAASSIQGIKVNGSGGNTTPPSAERVTLDGGGSTTANPFYFSSIASGKHTVTTTVPTGWAAGYSVCYNSIGCHVAANIQWNATTATIDIPDGQFADFYWHYVQNPTVTITSTLTSITIGQSATLTATFSPSTGDTLTNTAINVIAPNTSEANTPAVSGDYWKTAMRSTLSYTFTPTQPGTYVFKPYVTSQAYPIFQTTPSSKWVTVVVNAAPTPTPTPTPTPSVPGMNLSSTATTLTIGQSATLTATFAPGAGDTLTNTAINMLSPGTTEYSVSYTGWVWQTPVKSTLTYTFTPTKTGTYTFKPYATSQSYPAWQGTTQNKWVTVTVSAVPTPTPTPTPTPAPQGPCATVLNGIVSVRAFGAKGDGVTDDTKALADAMQCVATKLNAGAIAELYLPPGTYRSASTLRLQQPASTAWRGLTIRGEGRAVSTIVSSVTGSTIDLQFTAQVPTTLTDFGVIADTLAGTGIKISMPPQNTGSSSLTIQRLEVMGTEYSTVKYFTIPVELVGVSQPIVKDTMVGIGFGVQPLSGMTAIRYGTACMVLRDVYGATLDYTQCMGMTNGYDITSLGGPIIVTSLHELAISPDIGLRIRAGRGSVSIDGAHVAAGMWNYDIDNASSVTLKDTLTLHWNFHSNVISSAVDTNGIIRVTNSDNVIIKNNFFLECLANSAIANCTPRTAVYIGAGNKNVQIIGNHFSGSVRGIYIAPGTTGTTIDANRFFQPFGTDIVNNDPGATIKRVPNTTWDFGSDWGPAVWAEPSGAISPAPAFPVAVPVAAGTCSAVRNGTANVRDFGAKGDGVTDDTTAFQNALSCLQSFFLTGKGNTFRAQAALYIPAGRYNVTQRLVFAVPASASTVLRQGLEVRGEGSTSSVVVSSSPSGAFVFGMPGNNLVILSLKSFGVTARGVLPGPAFDIVPDQGTDAAANVPKVYVHASDIDVRGVTSSDRFGYGVRARKIAWSVFDTFKMQGVGSTACWWADDSYGVSVRKSSCTGAVYGYNAPLAAEANIIRDSEFLDVGTAIRMQAIPGQGSSAVPSNWDGKILNNRIRASVRGVDLYYKSFFSIQGNTFESTAGDTPYTDILLRNSPQVIVTENTFVGGGLQRTGVSVAVDRTSKATLDTTIARNTFGALNTGVAISSGVLATYVINNTFTGTRLPIDDKGTGTYKDPVSTVPPSLSITSTATTLTIGQSATLTATFAPGAGDTLQSTAINIYPPNAEGRNAVTSGAYWQTPLKTTLSYAFTPTEPGTYVFRPYAQTTSNPAAWQTSAQDKWVTIVVQKQEPNPNALDFGGMWGYVNGTLVGTPATLTASCPAGFASTQIHGTAGLDWPAGFCHRTPDASPLYDFGGMYGYVLNSQQVVNPATNAMSCPVGYTAQQFSGYAGLDLPAYYCYRPHVTGQQPALRFGGMFGVVNNTTIVNNPATNAASCPVGYSTNIILLSSNVDTVVVYCWAK